MVEFTSPCITPRSDWNEADEILGLKVILDESIPEGEIRLIDKED